jgi:hypothetical protein
MIVAWLQLPSCSSACCATLEVAAAAGSQNPGIAASAQCPAAARATPSEFALGLWETFF